MKQVTASPSSEIRAMIKRAKDARFSPHLEYDDEQGAFHADMLRDDAGCWISAADYDAMKAERDRLALDSAGWCIARGDMRVERDRLAAALRDAATSLQTIATMAGRVNGDSDMTEMSDVRGYANSRWTVAYAAQTHVA